MADQKYWLWLTTRKGLGAVGALTVLDHFITPERAYYGEKEDYEPLALSPFAKGVSAGQEHGRAQQNFR